MTTGTKLKNLVSHAREMESGYRRRLRTARRKPRQPAKVRRNLRRLTMLWHARVIYREAKLAVYRKVVHAPLRLRALHVAETLVGVMEQGGNNNGPVVGRIIHENGGVIGEPWCGDFVAYAYRHAGSKAVQRGWASTLQLGFLTGQKRVTLPQPGDIVVYDFPGGASSDHTGIFVKFIPGGIEAIEGNTGATGAVSDSATGGDGVYRKHRTTNQVARYVRVLR